VIALGVLPTSKMVLVWRKWWPLCCNSYRMA